jgi:L-aminopeptidase/D-esterase-like protein
VIFDLGIGRSDRWADAEMGYAACASADTTTAEGCVGAGTGATVGKILGPTAAMKSGMGTWSVTLPDGTVIGALAVCNAFGDVWGEDGRILAGVRDVQQGGFADAMRMLHHEQNRLQFGFKAPGNAGLPETPNTTLAVVATNARLSKAEVTKLAQMAQDALPRTIRPTHTTFDGDTVFALSTGNHPAPHMTILGSLAVEVLVQALQRAVTQAVSAGGMPAMRDL